MSTPSDFETDHTGLQDSIGGHESCHLSLPLSDFLGVGEPKDQFDPGLRAAALSLDNSLSQLSSSPSSFSNTLLLEEVASSFEHDSDSDAPFVPPLPSQRVLRPRRCSVVFGPQQIDGDNDRVSESAGGNATDDEYLPDPPRNSFKRRREAKEDITSESLSLFPSRVRSPINFPLVYASAATRQSPKKTLAIIKSGPPVEWTAAEIEKWTCQVCGFVQHSKRKQDFKRHLRTHGPRSFVCCGIPIEDAGKYKKPATDKVRGEVDMSEVGWRIGGCRRPFSRLDALKRHLRTEFGRECLTELKFKGNARG